MHDGWKGRIFVEKLLITSTFHFYVSFSFSLFNICGMEPITLIAGAEFWCMRTCGERLDIIRRELEITEMRYVLNEWCRSVIILTRLRDAQLMIWSSIADRCKSIFLFCNLGQKGLFHWGGGTTTTTTTTRAFSCVRFNRLQRFKMWEVTPPFLCTALSLCLQHAACDAWSKLKCRTASVIRASASRCVPLYPLR
jgi:hypothetical protein